MPTDIDRAVDSLRSDYTSVRGRPFVDFFCRILFRDEAALLCRGHVINEAFPDSARRTVVQRSDVDAFFGSTFEADFVLLTKKGVHSSAEVVLDRTLSRQLRPKLMVDGRHVEHYLPEGRIPVYHSEVSVERDGASPVRLALKLEHSDALSALQGNWEISIEKDLRLPALVSLLKAAHLSMFSLLGYSYALSAGGHFLGWEVLGKFASDNMTLARAAVLANARMHFRQFANLVRPMLGSPSGLSGTVSDSTLFLCTGSPKAWSFMVLISTGVHMHALLVPVMEDAEGAARFARFLSDPAPRFEVRLVRFAGNRWEAAKDTRVLEWPAAAFE